MQKTYNATLDYVSIFPYRKLEYIAQPSSGDLSKFPYILLEDYKDRKRPDEWTGEISFTDLPSLDSPVYASDYLLGSRWEKIVNYSADIYYNYFKREASNKFRGSHSETGSSIGGTYTINRDLGTSKHIIHIYTSRGGYQGNWEVSLDGELIKKGDIPSSFVIVNSFPWGLFWYHSYENDNGRITEEQHPTAPGVKLYSLKFWQYGVTGPYNEVELVPVQRKIDGAVGLYDLNAQKFLTNSNSTPGAYNFVAGPTVDEYWDPTNPS